MSAVTRAALPKLAKKIITKHEAAEQCARDAISHALAAGRLLIEAKDSVGHGGFGPWLDANFEFSDSTAQNYMTLARRWPELKSKTQHAGNLSIRGALRLLSAPADKPPAAVPANGRHEPSAAATMKTDRYPGILIGTSWFRASDRSGDWLQDFGAFDLLKLAGPKCITIIRTSGSKEATRRADVLLGRWRVNPIDWAIVVTSADDNEELVIGTAGNVDAAEWLPHPLSPEPITTQALLHSTPEGSLWPHNHDRHRH